MDGGGRDLSTGSAARPMIRPGGDQGPTAGFAPGSTRATDLPDTRPAPL